ncbi:MAG: GntR family transcriptional regulator [Holophaga sp.]|nr:GntR family transcriptional regulator [Holophaga sp.]
MPNVKPLIGLSRAGAVNRTSIAYDSLKNSIFTNEIKPGDYLSENQVAQSLGMSRTPIREALKVLASEGLVEIHNGVGIFVKQVTTKELSDLFEVRAALECAALHSSLEVISDQEIDGIVADWMECKRKIQAGQKTDIDQILLLDKQLHSLIVERCANGFLKSVIDGIQAKIMRYRRLSALALNDGLGIIEQHLELMNCMKTRNIENLSKMLKEHIWKAANNIIRNPNWVI